MLVESRILWTLSLYKPPEWLNQSAAHYSRIAKKAPRRELFAEEEGLEPPSLTAAVFKTADLPISLFLQLVRKE